MILWSLQIVATPYCRIDSDRGVCVAVCVGKLQGEVCALQRDVAMLSVRCSVLQYEGHNCTTPKAWHVDVLTPPPPPFPQM